MCKLERPPGNSAVVWQTGLVVLLLSRMSRFRADVVEVSRGCAAGLSAFLSGDSGGVTNSSSSRVDIVAQDEEAGGAVDVGVDGRLLLSLEPGAVCSVGGIATGESDLSLRRLTIRCLRFRARGRVVPLVSAPLMLYVLLVVYVVLASVGRDDVQLSGALGVDPGADAGS